MLLGAALGLVLLLLFGTLLGASNRGMGGALVGALSGSLCGVLLGAIAGSILGTRYFPQEGSVRLSIELDKQDDWFAPGETLTGQVEIRADDTLRVSGGKVYLVCRGFYAHDEIAASDTSRPTFVRRSSEYLVQQAELMSAALIRRERSQIYPFRFLIPLDALPTHHGYICSVRWTVHAVVYAPDIPFIRAHREFLVESAPPVSLRAIGERQSIVLSRVCQLVMGLPHVIYAEGETVSGHVHLTPFETFDAQEVRAVLLRIENVEAGDDHFVYVVDDAPPSGILRGHRRHGGHGTTYVWLEGEDHLTSPVTFRAAQTVTLLFRIRLPPHRQPTVSTGDGSVIWKVGVIVSRQGGKDVRVFHEVIVHTGALRIAGPRTSAHAGWASHVP